jgi:hypothetical protein
MRHGPSHLPSFTLMTCEGRVPIIGGHYRIERPLAHRELGRLRDSGFGPGDDILVIGATVPRGISADEVFGGTHAQFRQTLEERRGLSVLGRRMGLVLLGLGLLLLALWATPPHRSRANTFGAAIPELD